MNRSICTATPPQQALQSYLDALLHEAAAELAGSVAAPAVGLPEPAGETPAAVAPVAVPPRAAIAEHAAGPASSSLPAWGQAPFECLLFEVAGLTLAVPLVCLGSIHPLAGQPLTPLFGQPDWVLGILPSAAGNLKVLDTARWVMPERYREEFRQGLQYVISVQGHDWALAVHQVRHAIRLQPREVRWRTRRSQRPWLAGTVIEQMCALLDVGALAELIGAGAERSPPGGAAAPSANDRTTATAAMQEGGL